MTIKTITAATRKNQEKNPSCIRHLRSSRIRHPKTGSLTRGPPEEISHIRHLVHFLNSSPSISHIQHLMFFLKSVPVICPNFGVSPYRMERGVLFQSFKSYTRKPFSCSLSFCSICRAIIPYCSVLFLLCQSTWIVFSCSFSKIF